MGSPHAASFQQALLLLQQGNVRDAQERLLVLTRQAPVLAEAWFLLALCQSQLGHQALAIESNTRAIHCNPQFAEAYINRGADLLALARYDEAAADLQNAVALSPAHPQAWLNLGNVQRETSQLEAAQVSFAKALEFAPAYLDAWCNLADVLGSLGRVDEAIHACHEALCIEPNAFQVLNALGLIYATEHRYEQAIDAYERAIRANSQHAAAYNNLGLVLMALKRTDTARLVLDQALLLEPGNPAANNNMGNLLMSLGKPEEAVGYLQAAYEVDPAHEYVTGALLHAKMKVCDWEGYASLLDTALTGATSDQKYAQVFTILSVPSKLAQQKKCAEHYVMRQFGQVQPLALSVTVPANGKIRIAYLSADFFNHATAFLMAGLFELHDRARFEIIGICYGRSPNDDMRRRVIRSFDQFHEVADQSDREIAELIHGLGIDIAVDLKGHTTDTRLGILAYRPAPVQVHYLGYPGTTGAPFIDYLMADPVLIPPAHQPYYTEKIAYLPDSYQVNDSQRQISERDFSRVELGLPETGFVFCSFNNNLKITPDLFEVWMNLLKRVDGSVLWLLQDTPAAAENLRKEAAVRGVDVNRLIFAERMPLAEHLARHRCADLFLDTWYYNAHTTASDALWAGLPLVTKIGDTFAGRVAASLLTAMNLPELITETPAAYEALAYELATNPYKLQALRDRLAANRRASPLFDTPRFTRNIEQCYDEMLSSRSATLA